MVTFRLSKAAAPGDEPGELDDDVSVSSGSLVEGLEAPTTPDAAPDAAASGAATKTKYWPTEEEVAAVLDRLPDEDRAQCDAAMANRCGGRVQGWSRAGGERRRPPVQLCRAAVPLLRRASGSVPPRGGSMMSTARAASLLRLGFPPQAPGLTRPRPCMPPPSQIPARHGWRCQARRQAHRRDAGVAAGGAAGGGGVHSVPSGPQEPLYAGGGA